MSISQEEKMVREVTDLLEFLKTTIEDDWRAGDDCLEDDDPATDVTIATTDGDEWSYQTGDNSFSGSCYFYQFWGVGYLGRETDCAELAREMVDQVFEQLEICNG